MIWDYGKWIMVNTSILSKQTLSTEANKEINILKWCQSTSKILDALKCSPVRMDETKW